eukprot:jgi/Botrbrau1/15630/Bobra.4_1s0015.1
MASQALKGVSLQSRFCSANEEIRKPRRTLVVRAQMRSEDERQTASPVAAVALAGIFALAPLSIAAAAPPVALATQGDLLAELLEKNSGKGVKVIKGKAPAEPPPAFSSIKPAAKPAPKVEKKEAPKKQEKPKPAPPKLQSQKLTLAAPPRTATQGTAPVSAVKKAAPAPPKAATPAPVSAAKKAAPAAAAAGAAALAGAAAAGAAAVSAPSISLPGPPPVSLPSVSLPSFQAPTLSAPTISATQADALEAGAVLAAELLGVAVAGAVVGGLTAKGKTA